MCVKRRSFLFSSAALLAGSMLESKDSHADQMHPRHVHAASLMTECAKRFLAALDADQGAKATFPFDSGEPMNWHFIPRERKGRPLREMTPYQKHLAVAMLAPRLIHTRFSKAAPIKSLY